MKTPVERNDLVGVWALDYSGKLISDNPGGKGFGVETLTFNPDGTYTQVFEDGSPTQYPKSTGKWELDKSNNGLHLLRVTNLRLYMNGVADAIGTTPPPTTSFVIEESSDLPIGGTNRLILCFQDVNVNFCFRRTR